MGRAAGGAKTGGRQKGSLDRQQRQLVSAELASDILTVFRAMGGTLDMLRWAEANRTVFYTQILSRLMPTPLKEDDIITVNQLNIGSDLDAAMRIAFVMRKGLEQQQEPPIEANPDD